MAGVERVTAWADLLDQINVFPVADGDTGRNLAVSLAPLRRPDRDREQTIHALLLAARGNAGNIAARFLSGFLCADSLDKLPAAAAEGRRLAWQAVYDPRHGTMLTVFDALVEGMDVQLFPRVASSDNHENAAGALPPEAWGKGLLDRLEAAVRRTPELLPKLKQAGVVDAGALGAFLFFEGFFYTLLGMNGAFRPITVLFKDHLRISDSFRDVPEAGYCIDAVLDAENASDETLRRLSAIGDSVVLTREAGYLKIHLHTDNREGVREKLTSVGPILRWTDDDLQQQTADFAGEKKRQAVHIMTDAAGSVTREDARRLGMTLLDSYITTPEDCLPETHLRPADLYAAMRRGAKIATSQASVFERHQSYQSALSRYGRVLYLCVGSVFTGNYAVATAWKKDHDRDDGLQVIDTAAASGRLGLAAIATARRSLQTGDREDVVAFAIQAVHRCEEYIFLDRLHYLAAGGRMSRAGAAFGDLLHMKPVISPLAEGAKKVGLVKNRTEQTAFALERLAQTVRPDEQVLLMLEYTDNRTWLEGEVATVFAGRYPRAEIILQPLSLTTGVHTGPGTWALAFLPDMQTR
jgi:uncharacterized protein